MAALLAAGMLGTAGMYAQQTPSGKSGDFRGHWFISVQGGIGQTVGETSFGNMISPAAAFNFGYRFTPVWGLRAGLSGWQAKGALVGPTEMYSYNYLQGNVDVMADICSIFSGYRKSRAVSPYLFAGVGINGAFNNAEAQTMASRFPDDGHLWNGSKILPAGRFGVGTGIRITDAVQFNLEVNANFLGDKFNSKQGSAVDWQLGALAGFTFNIGMKKDRPARQAAAVQTTHPAPVADSPASPEPTRKSDEEPARAETIAAPVEPAVTPSKDETSSSPDFKEQKRDIFFTIGKYTIRKSEEQKLEEIVSLAQSHQEVKISITGYADPQTGSAKRNMYLSRKRAEAVSAWLEAHGVPAERLDVAYKGASESPYGSPEENRVAVCIIR